MSPPTVDQFLSEISRILRERNGPQLQDFLIIEPPFGQLYHAMIAELRQFFPANAEGNLESKCSNAIPEARDGLDGSPWTAFIKFVVQYFSFIRDVDTSNLLATYNSLSELVQKSISALGHPTLGVLVLPTVVSYAHMLARLAIGLDKQPELIAHLTRQATDDGGLRETLPERAANIIRQAFVTCLNDRASTTSFNGAPEGKKLGIYRFANLCLKVLFQCRKTRNAEQIFVNIYNQSPSLSHYPRSQQTTYLYYLGRFLFSNNHFYRAQLALQQAYSLCHTKCIKQRRLILIYLVASNVILGRFPSQQLYSRPEAEGLAVIFIPICQAMAQGDVSSFWHLTSLNGPHADWLRHYRILLQLRNRCEVIVWRSLLRKTFIVNGNFGDSNIRKAATFNLEDVVKLYIFLRARSVTKANDSDAQAPGGKPGVRHTNWIFMQSANSTSRKPAYIDPDFEGMADQGLGGKTTLSAQNAGVVGENEDWDYMLETESIISSLVDQELLKGYISHSLKRFAIQGAKVKGPLAAGFPNVWQTIKAREERNSEQIEVPGWKRNTNTNLGAIGAGAKFGPGMVVNLSGARPVGMAQ